MKKTSLCYIRRGEEVLLLHRVNRKKQTEGVDENAGKWIGIGGKFLEGETPEQCVLREVREETGLVLTEYSYRGVIDFSSNEWGREQMHLFTATAFEGTSKECDEGELEWISMQAYLSLPMWEGDRIFLSLIEREDTPFFRLSLQYQGEKLISAVLDGESLSLG